MPRIGVVIKEIEEDQVVISTSRRGVCENCSENSSCSLESDHENEPVELVIAMNHLQAQPGDTVEFDLAGHTELKISLVVWVVPLIGLLVGAFCGAIYHGLVSISKDAGTFIGAITGFLAAFGLIILYDRRHTNSAELIPHILRIKESSCEVKSHPPSTMEV